MTEDGDAESCLCTLEAHGLRVWAISSHLIGQCVGDQWEPRLDNFAPTAMAGRPEEIQQWAVRRMATVARAAHRLGIGVVTGFLGSPIWPYWYSFPQTTKEMVDTGFRRIKELWSPIFDVFDEEGVRFAFEVHPTEIAFDYYSTERLLETFEHRPTLGLNLDPSHLVWQGVDPVLFVRGFRDRIYHVHMKDVKVRHDGLSGVLGSHLEFGDTRRGWDFVSLGHGDVDLAALARALDANGHTGPLTAAWDDSALALVSGSAYAL